MTCAISYRPGYGDPTRMMILTIIPLTRQAFWGPMAMSIMGGIIVATVLTVLFLPALYAAWYRVKKPIYDPNPNDLLTLKSES